MFFTFLQRAAILAVLLTAFHAVAGVMPQSGGPSQTPATNDLANAAITGSISSTAACSTAGTSTAGCSGWFTAQGRFNIVFGGSSGPNGSYSATIEVDRSFDGGTTWYVVGVGGAGQQAIYALTTDVSVEVVEPEKGVLYRLRCTTFSSGPVNYRISTTGGASPTYGSPW